MNLLLKERIQIFTDLELFINLQCYKSNHIQNKKTKNPETL